MNYKCVHIDFETRSAIDLKKAGTHVYATDKTTDALCLAYAFDDGPIKLWKLGESGPFDLMQAVHKGIKVAAHNAHFEWIIWNYVCVKKYGWPSLKLTQLDCTMIRAFSMGLPGTLEKASKAVGLNVEKDMKGHRIMLQLSQPRDFNEDGSPLWWQFSDSTDKLDIKAKYEKLYKYCMQDINVERELDKRLLPLSDRELKLWRLDQKINLRGVYCDLNAAKAAMGIVEVEKKRLNNKIKLVTKNDVATCNASVALKDWINTFDIFKGKRYKEDGPVITYQEDKETKRRKQWHKNDLMICQGVGKDLVLDMLDMNIPKVVKSALKIRQEAAKSSNAKLAAMISGASKDSRVRGCFQYYGAASTGRWAGRRIQLHNLTRPTIKQDEIETIIDLLNSGAFRDEITDTISIFHGAPMTRISDCLRGLLMAAPGKKFIAADWSAIEARILAWLAGQESILNIFRGHGKIYEHTAQGIYHLEYINHVNANQRLIGKVATLALGFQGGKGAFQSMAKVYFIKIPDAQAEEIKVAWRADNPHIVNYWYAVERCAISAVENPGQKFSCGPAGRQVVFLQKGSFLFCCLPSGRAICYPYPKMKSVKTPWGTMKNALTYKGEENYQFVAKVAYGGLLAENITQATARDILAQAMPRVEKAGYPIVMHIHDEIVTEVDQGFGSVKELEDLLCVVPVWAKGLPLKATGWQGERFRK